MLTGLQVLAVVAVWVLFARGEAAQARLFAGSAAAVAAFVAFGKVISPQFLICPAARAARPRAAAGRRARSRARPHLWFPERYWTTSGSARRRGWCCAQPRARGARRAARPGAQSTGTRRASHAVARPSGRTRRRRPRSARHPRPAGSEPGAPSASARWRARRARRSGRRGPVIRGDGRRPAGEDTRVVRLDVRVGSHHAVTARRGSGRARSSRSSPPRGSRRRRPASGARLLDELVHDRERVHAHVQNAPWRFKTATGSPPLVSTIVSPRPGVGPAEVRRPDHARAPLEDVVEVAAPPDVVPGREHVAPAASSLSASLAVRPEPSAAFSPFTMQRSAPSSSRRSAAGPRPRGGRRVGDVGKEEDLHLGEGRGSASSHHSPRRRRGGITVPLGHVGV